MNLLPKGRPHLQEWAVSAFASAMDAETMTCQMYVVLKHLSVNYLGTLDWAGGAYIPLFSVEAAAQVEGIEHECQILDGPTLILHTAASQFLVIHRHGSSSSWLAHQLTVEGGPDREVQPLLWQADETLSLHLWTSVCEAKAESRARQRGRAPSVPQRNAQECYIVGVAYTGAMQQPLWRVLRALPLPLPQHPAPGRWTHSRVPQGSPNVSGTENCSPNLPHDTCSPREHVLTAGHVRGAFLSPLPKHHRQAFVGAAAIIGEAPACCTCDPMSRAQAPSNAGCPVTAATPAAIGTQTRGAWLHTFQQPHRIKTSPQGAVGGPLALSGACSRAAERSHTCLVVETPSGNLQALELPTSAESCSTVEIGALAERSDGVPDMVPDVGRACGAVPLPCRLSAITFHRSALGGIAAIESRRLAAPGSHT